MKSRETVVSLSGGKAAGVCNNSVGLLKGGGVAMIQKLHAVLTAMWQSGTYPLPFLEANQIFPARHIHDMKHYLYA